MGSDSDPASLHRYLYASGDPVNRMDPGGREDFSLSGIMASSSMATSLGGILDSAELSIKDQFAAAAGMDISQEKVFAVSIVDSTGLSSDWVAPLQESIQRLEMAVMLFHLVSHIADLTKAIKQVNGNPPFSKFANALGSSDDELETLADEDADQEVTSNGEAQELEDETDCNNCLVAGTVVQMANGTTKSIEKVQPNDVVISRNPETGKTEPEQVSQTISRKSAVIMTIHFASPKTGKEVETVVCTPEHPFYGPAKEWVPAGMLLIGDNIVAENGHQLKVVAITWQRDEKHGFTVYNLTVENDHTYFIGTEDGGIWVHNCYRTTWFAKHPQYPNNGANSGIEIHHAKPQAILKKYPGLFTRAELDQLDNLRGIDEQANGGWMHRSSIYKSWRSFYKSHPAATVTRADVQAFADHMDNVWGGNWIY